MTNNVSTSKPYTSLLRSSIQESPVTALASGAATVNLMINENCSHNFAGVVYFSDAEGETFVTPAAGTETYTLRTVVQPQGFQSFASNTSSSSQIDQVDWAANTTEVRVVLAGVSATATHCKLIFSGNIS